MDRRQAVLKSALLSAALALAACDDLQAPVTAHNDHSASATVPSPTATAPQTSAVASQTPQPATEPAVTEPAVTASTPSAVTPRGSDAPQGQAIETAAYAERLKKAAKQALLIKTEILLDRAHFSPGVIDGRDGSNLRNALSAFEQSRGLSVDGVLSAPVFDALTGADAGPVTADYVITADDVKGPFLGEIPTHLADLAKLEAVGWATPLQALAAKFHMSEALLTSLNPGLDFGVAGTRIVVARPATANLPQPTARVEVDKAANQVRALDASGKIIAVFPATVGSTERPAPDGQWAVKTVVSNPNYSYDPKRLTFGDASKGPMVIAPGPNNPVGSTWIALTDETYGIHGTPDPTRVGKTASHGCVRLTNWDAATLGRAVKKGTPVVFVGSTTKKA